MPSITVARLYMDTISALKYFVWKAWQKLITKWKILYPLEAKTVLKVVVYLSSSCKDTHPVMWRRLGNLLNVCGMASPPQPMVMTAVKL